ncbi:hypothetical protein ACFPRL_34195 [Pseudoclavibacter helvolus]
MWSRGSTGGTNSQSGSPRHPAACTGFGASPPTANATSRSVSNAFRCRSGLPAAHCHGASGSSRI